MSDYGFRINRVRAEDKTAPPAELLFGPGLNVVTGDSNTGKSYLRVCFDFMLGSDTVPKDIDEAKPYENLYLEIQDKEENVYTLRRSLKGGEFHLYANSFEEIHKSTPRILTTKGKETLSVFLLALCGIKNAKIRLNKLNKTETLTFRTMSHLFIVDETAIISEHSPIHLPDVKFFTQTKAKALFNLLLTGKDDSSLVEMPEPKIEKAQLAAKREVYDQLIAELEDKINGHQVGETRIQEEMNRLKQRIGHVSQAISISHKSIFEQQQVRQENWKLLKEKESRIIVLDELLTRFELLQQHYTSDLQRLDFISEGDHYFEQLEATSCPICGSSLEAHSKNRECLNINGDRISLMQACREEAAKINTHIHDLESTVSELKKERQELSAEVRRLQKAIESSEHRIQEELHPRQLSEQTELENLLTTRSALSELEVNFLMLQELKTARDLAQKPTGLKTSSTKVNQGLVDRAALRKLGDIVQNILERWKFPENGVVEFDEQTMDFIVNGKPRVNNGKGVRALIHSAFNIALMRFCKGNGLPHPGIVVLDSPLTTLRENRQDGVSEDVSGEIQMAFFEDLADSPKDEQVIVLENKIPPKDVRDRITYYEFRREGEGRRGFYPLPQSKQLQAK